jgi:hypothetical protein
MPLNSPNDYSRIQTLCNILQQYASQCVYNNEQVEILEASLESLHAESLEAESNQQQLESARALAAQSQASEVASFARLRALFDSLNTEL